MTAKETMRAAAALIRKHGWWNGRGPCPDPIDGPPYCLATSLRAVPNGAADAAWDEVRRRIGIDEADDKYGSTPRWNDRHTKDEVLAVLEAP